jgi:hypothetical protein
MGTVEQDIRTHVVGDLLMLTGTFVAGGREVDYSSHLTSVIASGGHITSGIVTTGVLINQAAHEAAGQTTLTVDGTNATLALYPGQSIYAVDGTFQGVLAGVAATELTLEAPGLIAQMDDDAPICVFGAYKPGVTLIDKSLDISVDETRNVLIIDAPQNTAVPDGTSDSGGRWWILGQR